MQPHESPGFFLALASVLRSPSSLEVLCNEVTGTIASALPAQRGSIILRADPGAPFCVTAVSGPPRSEVIRSLNVSCSGAGLSCIEEVLKSGETRIVESLPEGIGIPHEGRAAALSPLFCKGQGMGVLIVEAAPESLLLVDGIARYISLALENIVLSREGLEAQVERVHETETFQLMNEISREILSNLKTEEIVETVIQMTRRVIPCDGATVALFDSSRSVLVVSASWGTGIDRGTELSRGDIPFLATLESGRPVYQNDITRDFRECPRQMEWAAEKSVFSYFTMPLQVKGEFWGILILSSMRPAWFTRDHISTAEKLATHVGIALENARLLEHVQELFMGTVSSLVATIDAKSQWTKGHSLRVADYAVEFGRKLGLGRAATERLRLAAILHDIGKIGTFEKILDKPGALTPEEMEIVRQHPSLGAAILSPLKTLNDIIPVIRHHHERFDGAGYPGGLSGEDIPHEARLLTLVDSYDAMRSDRPYRRGLTPAEAIVQIQKGAGSQFDPTLASLFLELIGNRG